ncbi:dynamin family protein [Brevibacillus sp. 179-C9.3 HS]|uniref:dynamin family protein n=1 Tax=unclassified Brevibacillus TaxID=2684853 RepID=UPI0039A332AE
MKPFENERSLLINSAERAYELARRIGFSTMQGSAAALIEKLNQPSFYMTLVGRTSSGKTSIINSLIGREKLKVSASPTTPIVTEVIGGREYLESYGIVHRDGKREAVSKEQFDQQFVQPLPTLRRLQLKTTTRIDVEAHILDTPGYDSIYEQHTEVLNNFIPEADYLVFCVMYRSGIVEADKQFLELLYQVFEKDLPPLLLVINRAPNEVDESDRRVAEIRKHVQNLIGSEVKLFLVAEQAGAPVPQAEHVWRWLGQEMVRPERTKAWLERAKLVLQSIYENLESATVTKWQMAELDSEQREGLRVEIVQLRESQKKIQDLVIRRRNEMIEELQVHVSQEQSKISKACDEHITTSNRWTQAADCNAFIQSHVLPKEANLACKRTGELLIYRLEELNDEIEELANTAIGNYIKEVNFIMDKFEKLRTNALKGILNEGLKNVAFQFFQRFGGRGGAGAGVANFGKMALKRIGNVFNKTFSRATHNKLAHILARLGATSTKAIGNVIAVLIELGFYLWGVATWQGKLKATIDKSLKNWTKELNPKIVEELDLSLDETMVLVNEHFDITCMEHEEMLSAHLDKDQEQLEGFEELIKTIQQEREHLRDILSEGVIIHDR